MRYCLIKPDYGGQHFILLNSYLILKIGWVIGKNESMFVVVWWWLWWCVCVCVWEREREREREREERERDFIKKEWSGSTVPD